MASRLYLPAAGDINITPAFAAFGLTTNMDRRRAARSKTATALTNKVSAAVGVTTTRDVGVRQYLSDPLSGAQTITGTVKGVVQALESLATANAQAQCTIRVVSKDGTTVRGTLLALSTAGATSEFATALTSRKFPLAWVSPGTTLSSVSAQDGDRIAVDFGARFIATTVATTTATLRFGDTGTTDLAEDETGTTTTFVPWLELSQTLTFQAVPELAAIGTYLTYTAATAAAPIVVPSGGAINDIAIVPLYKESTAVVTAPAGFTEFATLTATDHTQHLFWKRLTGADSGTYNFTWTGNAGREGYALLYRNCVTSGNPYEAFVSAINNVASVTTPAVTVTPLTDNSRIVWTATNFAGGNPWTPPTNWAERTAGTGLRDMTVADRVWNGLGSSGSLTGTAGSARSTAAGFALKPAGAAAPGFDVRLASMFLVGEG